MKATKLLIAVMALAVVCAGYAFAATPGGAAVSGERDLGETGAIPSAGSTNLEAGNITYADLETNQSTFRWVGLLGNVSGTILLGDTSNNTLYQWTGAGNVIYASQASSIDWTQLTDSTYAETVGFDAWVGGGNSDNISNTFNETGGTVPSNIFTGLTNANYAQTFDNVGTPTWQTFALDDTVAAVYAGAVISAGTAFNAETVDYQMIIPEDGTANDGTPTPYNLWVELE